MPLVFAWLLKPWGQAALPTDYDMRLARQRMEEALGCRQAAQGLRCAFSPQGRVLAQARGKAGRYCPDRRRLPPVSGHKQSAERIRLAGVDDFCVLLDASGISGANRHPVGKVGCGPGIARFQGQFDGTDGGGNCQADRQAKRDGHHPPTGVHPIQGDAGSGAGTGQTRPGNPDRHGWLCDPDELHQGRRRCHPGLRA